ncbi:unnamed protein product [Prunus armeniaca]
MASEVWALALVFRLLHVHREMSDRIPDGIEFIKEYDESRWEHLVGKRERERRNEKERRREWRL